MTMSLSKEIAALKASWPDAGNDVYVELKIIQILERKLKVAEDALQKLIIADDYFLWTVSGAIALNALKEIKNDEM